MVVVVMTVAVMAVIDVCCGSLATSMTTARTAVAKVWQTGTGAWVV